MLIMSADNTEKAKLIDLSKIKRFTIQELKNAKDFYEDKLDELGYTDSDKIFEEE